MICAVFHAFLLDPGPQRTERGALSVLADTPSAWSPVATLSSPPAKALMIPQRTSLLRSTLLCHHESRSDVHGSGEHRGCAA